jgi:thiamine kinase-like enzyme
VDAAAIARRLWPDADPQVEPLGGGITNHNFKVSLHGEQFVLRIGGRETALLGIDREVERAATENAAALGLGPELVRFVDGCLVTRFVDGVTGRAAPREVGPMLRRLHDGPAIPGRFDSFRVVEEYARLARQRGVEPPPEHERASATARRIAQLRCEAPLRPCHNDLLAANFVHDGERPWLVDWEYAGMGDPYFDLANYAVNNGLDEAGEQELLDGYGGGDPRALTLMRLMSEFREAMWGVVQQAISELDFDFRGYAAEHFERLARTAREPRFRQALTEP